MPGFDAATLALIGAASLAAFVVRGLSGFGSSMIGIGSLSLALPPALVVPAFMVVELLTSVHLLPSVWRQIDWRSLRWVAAGCVAFTPIGMLLLAHLDPDPMRAVVSLCLLGIATWMLRGAGAAALPRPRPGPAGAFGVGALSGLLNGTAGIGGPPAIVFYFATTGVAVSRATLIAYLLITDVFAIAAAGAHGLMTRALWPLVAACLPFSIAGIWIGHRLYGTMDEARLRRTIWWLLAALGALGTLGAAARLLR